MVIVLRLFEGEAELLRDLLWCSLEHAEAELTEVQERLCERTVKRLEALLADQAREPQLGTDEVPI